MSKSFIDKVMLASGVSISTVLLSLTWPFAANAEEITYDGTQVNILQTERSGAFNPYKSLFSTSSKNNNKIVVGSEAADAVQAEWATKGAVNAPYIIYGGVDIRPNTKSRADLVESGADISNNNVQVKNVRYDWSEQKNVDGGLSLDGSNANGGGIGGGSIFGGLSVGAASNQGSSDQIGGRGGIVNGNKVTLQNVDIKGNNGGDGLAGNTGTVQNGALSGGIGGLGGASVFGGLSMGGSGSVITAYSGRGGEVHHNEVTLRDVVLTGGAGGKGGESPNGMVAGGAGGMGGASVFGGFSMGGAGGTGYGLFDASGGHVHDNIIALTNVTLHGDIGGNGGASMGGGGGNGGIGGGSVIGGASFGGAASAMVFEPMLGGVGGAVSNNQVTLTNVTLFGGAGGKGGKELITNGAGFGHDGLPGGTVVGGLSIGGAGLDYGGNAGDAIGNTIKITGKSFIWGSIYGGYSIGGANNLLSDQDDIGFGGKTTNNVVTLEGSDIKIGKRDESGHVTSYGSIWGGRSVNGDNSENTDFDKVVSGNTLNLVAYRGMVAGIYNFENYNWTLPERVKNGDVLVTIAENGTAVNLTNTKHTIKMYNDGSRLNDGDAVTMINKTTGALETKNFQIHQGNFIFYDAVLKQQGNGDKALVLVIQKKTDDTPKDDGGNTDDNHNSNGNNTDDHNGNNGSGHNGNNLPDNGGQSAAKLNPQSRSYAEGRVAALGLVSQGSDLLATGGIDPIRIITHSNQDKLNRYSFIPFMIAKGSSQRYKTGSHVDTNSFNMAVGFATGFNFAAGHRATIGAFFEYGRGTYDTYNSFTSFASVKGDGNTDYKGGGVFSRIDFAGTGLGHVKNLTADQVDGLYVETSLRAGRASSEFAVGKYADFYSNLSNTYRGSYDSGVTYFGGHVAGGYVFNFDDRQSVNAYGRYLWTYMDSDNVLVGNEKLHLDSSLSSRIQIGGRYSYAYSDLFKPYIGAGYEYEFDGEVKGKAYEFNLDRPSLEGSTGIFEAGFRLIPIATNKALSLDVNGQGYVGQRQGGGGGIKLKYEF